jgi:hypothetical protein
MKSAPALALNVDRFRAWRWAVGLLLAGATLSLGAWVAAGWPLGAAQGALVVVGLMAAAAAAALLRAEPFTLRWAAGVWQLDSCGTVQTGALYVGIDLGAWMLLRFAPQSGRWPQARWLPVGGVDDAGVWHAFRCAVHAPGAAAAHTDARPAGEGRGE